MELIIGGTTYKFEYSFEAAQYDDCVTSLYKLLSDSAEGSLRNDSSKVLASVAGKPSTVATLFCAGLLENNKISKAESDDLLKQYIKENRGKKRGTFYGIFQMINKQMEDDGFLEMLGLNTMVEEMTEAAKKKQSISLQDHKKKQEKTSQN